jgi:Na+/H+ antiporter NhaD/arsenite permease-like protein
MSIRVLRNWLNFIFIIGALVGMLIYVKYSRETGIYVILASMIVKFTESALRMIHKND